MSESENPQRTAPETMQNVALTADTIDVMMRNLELAKAQLQGVEDEQISGPDVVCTMIYGAAGTFCPLLYLHFPTVKEADSAEA